MPLETVVYRSLTQVLDLKVENYFHYLRRYWSGLRSEPPGGALSTDSIVVNDLRKKVAGILKVVAELLLICCSIWHKHCMATTEQVPNSQTVASDSDLLVSERAEFAAAIRAMLVVGVVAAVVYRHVLSNLALEWWRDPNYSHGFVMPIFAAFVIWRMRDRLLNMELRPSWWGLSFSAMAMGLLIIGDLGAEFFSSRLSLLILLAGTVLLMLGWNHLRALTFPGSMLLLMIPIPAIVLNQITFPLQLLASRLATALLSGVGVPVLREGNVIQLPSATLEVVDACSGIRSLISLIALAAIFGYLKHHRTWHRWLLVLLAVPIAVAANSVRIMGTGLLAQYWDPDKAEGFFHMFEGWVIFVLSLCLLGVADNVISRFSAPRQELG